MKFLDFTRARAVAWCFSFVLMTFYVPKSSAQAGSQCDQLQQLLDQYKQVHDACLAAHDNEKQVQETSEICSHPSCQAYHSYVYGAAGQELISKIAACRHAELFAQQAAEYQRQTDADQRAGYGNAAADANQLTDQYNNQAAGIQPYTMSNDVAQDIDSMNSAANSLSAQRNASDYIPGVNDTTISADNYVPPASSGSSDFDQATREAARSVLDEGIQYAVGKDNYEYYQDAKGLASGDTQKQLDGTFDLADKFNDKYNSGASKTVTHTLLPMLHNVYSNAFNLLGATMHAGSCIFSTDANCTDASRQLERQQNKFFADPFGKPLNSPSSNDWSNWTTGE
jgi:hypothetical protein